ncbi:MAG: hypothetical protein ACYDBV_14140 [Nitrospiria bacterium]
MKNIFVLNNGVIEKDAFHLLGASSKRDDVSKIGYFGSGLKYAIAWMLRNNIEFTVYSDGKEVKFSLIKKDFRNKSFDVIAIDGKETSITTEMGPDWNGWFALREIICNALDEEKGTYGFYDNEMVPQKGMTFFLIKSNTLFDDFVKNEKRYFAFKRKDELCKVEGIGSLYPSDGGLVMYRKGVQCYHDVHQPAIFNYNFDSVDINESRVASDMWGLRYKAFELINKADVDTKRYFLTHLKREKHEWELRNYSSIENNWLNAMEGYVVTPEWTPTAFIEGADLDTLMVLPDWLYDALELKFMSKLPRLKGADKDKLILVADEYQQKTIDSAKDIVEKCGFKIEAPIKLAAFRSVLVYGQCEDETIYVSSSCLEAGVFQTAATLLEEQLHYESEYNDKTREFQNYIFTKLLRELIKSKNIVI